MATKKIQILDSLNKNAVLYAPQELTKEEKLQARENINAASLDENGKVPLEQLPDDIGSGGGGEQVQADHAQNDDTQPDYIKNRIAYSNGVKNVEVFNQTLTLEYQDEMYAGFITVSDEFMNTYNNLGDITVTYDGTEYHLERNIGMGMSFYGNPVIMGLEPTDEPFLFYAMTGAEEDGTMTNMLIFISFTDPTPEEPDNAPTIDHTVVISYQEEDVYTDPKYFNIERLLVVGKGEILWNKTNYIFEVSPDEGMGEAEFIGYYYLPPEKNVKVYWDGVEYICKVQNVDGLCAIGDIGLAMGEESTGEPFLIGTDNNSFGLIYSFDTNPIHEMYIVTDEEDKKKISSEYLDIELNYDDQPTQDSENLLTSGVIYTALKDVNVKVTSDDNGKFMRVVDGVWAAVTVPNVEDGEF